MDFKERIFQARKAKGFSQEELAELVGVSRQAVSKWETGEAMPDTEKLITLCTVLDLDMEYLALGKASSPNGQVAKKPRKWIAVLLAAVCFVAGILLGHYWPAKSQTEPSPLESITISDVTVTPVKGVNAFEITICPSELPEGLAMAIMWGRVGQDPGMSVCIRDEDCYRVTVGYHGVFQYRITALLTLDGQEKEIRILDVYGDETEFAYDYIS